MHKAESRRRRQWEGRRDGGLRPEGRKQNSLAPKAFGPGKAYPKKNRPEGRPSVGGGMPKHNVCRKRLGVRSQNEIGLTLPSKRVARRSGRSSDGRKNDSQELIVGSLRHVHVENQSARQRHHLARIHASYNVIKLTCELLLT
jgi:hypothetical protein